MAGKLDHAYGGMAEGGAVEFYDDWAESYDDELGSQGYVTPKRCAEALIAMGADPAQPILDVGCGTGVSGAALAAAGFDVIDGVDPSAEMLARARGKDIYRAVREIDRAAPLVAPDSAYHNAVAAGVLSPDLAPPEALDQILEFLPVGGRLAFSLNDHAIADGAHLGRMSEIIDGGWADLEFKEYGDHIPGTGLKAYVYVLRKR
jgi:predicted TPR repeat methyltransferase